MTTVAAILKHKGYQVTTVDPTTQVARVVEVLAEHRIGAVLVIDRAEQLLGIVSERDIVRCLAANGARTLEMTAGAVDDPRATGGASRNHGRPGHVDDDARPLPPPARDGPHGTGRG